MTVRTFALIVGALLAVGAFIALALPVSIDTDTKTVGCGNAVRGVSLQARDSDRIESAFSGSESTIASDCRDAIGTRRSWGWPLVGIGVVVAAGALVIRRPPVPADSDRTTSES